MPRFSYTAKDASGKTITGTDEAADKDTLIARLQQQGLFIVSVEPFVSPLTRAQQSAEKPKPPKRGTHKKAKLDDMLVFARQLGTMLDSGVTLLRSLDVISLQVDSTDLSNALEQIRKEIEAGGSLSASLAKHPKIFDQFWVSLVEVGEASGTLPVILEKLAFYLEQKAAFQSAIVSAVMYPLILFLVAIGAVLFFALSVGPRFKGIFESFGIELPILTQVLLGIFSFIQKYFFMLLAGFGAILFVARNYTRTPSGKRLAQRLVMRLPKFGYVYRMIIVERFTSQMSILIDSGVPILYALDVTQRMIGDMRCADIIGNVKDSVREGKMLADPMAASGFFPVMVVQMVLSGEETGELAKMLRRVAVYYQD